MGATEDSVRLLIADTAPEQLLSDQQLTSLLVLEGGSVKLAAAQALDAIASSEALVGKKIRTQDLTTDGPAVAAALRAHATELRRQVQATAGLDLEESQFAFEVAATVPYPWYSAGAELAEGEFL